MDFPSSLKIYLTLYPCFIFSREKLYECSQSPADAALRRSLARFSLSLPSFVFRATILNDALFDINA